MTSLHLLDQVLPKLTSDIQEWERKIKDPAFKLSDLPAYFDAFKGKVTGLGIDDRKMLLERALVYMSRKGDGDPIAVRLQEVVIDLLYKDLPHPPGGYLYVPSTAGTTAAGGSAGPTSEPLKYAYRKADGSEYNVLQPTMGQARSPYARSVPSLNYTPRSSLPDPSLVFDTLLKRDGFVEHPGGISSLFFAFADLVIHSIFNTDHKDMYMNNASSYLDLSILYGNNDRDVDSIRLKDGTGRLHPDVFADPRLLFMPPSSCALLVLLSRNHNYIASKLLDINERGTFQSPPPVDEKAKQAQDDEIFHRTRLVNCGYFMQIILGDYVGAILGLVRDGHSWRLDPLKASREVGHEVSPRGEGNVVSIEFNMLYRWHATLSQQDAQWTSEQFKDLFPGKDLSTVTPDDFTRSIGDYMRKKVPRDPKQWTFNGLQRGSDGRFDDDDLARILQNATEWRAGAFKARGTPEALKVIEVLSIEQGRKWGACSLNEFRKFLGLKEYKTFKEWNPDERVWRPAEVLYKHIDNLELHVGLQAEETKDAIPGAGLCPGFTISRAILADAVCLTRGDRFLTIDFTPYNFTSWGYQDCQYDTEDGSYGGMLTKLLFRTLPKHYPARSAYAHFPFLTPDYIKNEMLKRPGGEALTSKYVWTRPPVPRGEVAVDTFQGVESVLAQPKVFVAPYYKRILSLSKNVGPVDKVQRLLFVDTDWAGYFKQTTRDLIRTQSISRVGSQSKKYVDIVGDVLNLLPVYWIAQMLIGLPLDTGDDHLFSQARKPHDLYKMFSDVCQYVFLNFDPENDWRLRENSIKVFEIFHKFCFMHFLGMSGFSGFLSEVNHALLHLDRDAHEFLRKLRELPGDLTPEQRIAALFRETVPTAAHFSQALSHVVNFYLHPSKATERAQIAELAHQGSGAGVLPFVREALRLDPPVCAVMRSVIKDTQIAGVHLAAGESIYASISKANLDRTVFGPDPTAPTYNRPVDGAGIFGVGEYGMLSSPFWEAIAPVILGEIFALQDVQHAPGESGKFNRFKEQWHGCPNQQYISVEGKVIPWPDSLIVQYAV